MRINKLAAASLLSVVATGSMVAASMGGAGASAAPHVARPSLVFPFGKISVTPNSQLVNGQKVTIKIDFNVPNQTVDPNGHVLYIGECSTDILANQTIKECDNSAPHSAQATLENGKASLSYTINTGPNFKGEIVDKKRVHCDPTHACAIVVTDSKDPSKIVDSGFANLNLGKKTKTVVTGKKSLKAGATLHLTAKTTKGYKLTGTVIFKDGKKTIAKVKEKASGKVVATEKKLKAGTHKITVSYSGDLSNVASKGSLTVKVKK